MHTVFPFALELAMTNRLLLLLLLSGFLTSCTSAESRLARGDSYYARGDYGQAIEEYDAARAQDPTLRGLDEKIQDARVRFHLQQGDRALARKAWQDAEACYREADVVDPGNEEISRRLQDLAERRANAHFLRGQELLTRSNPFDAILQFEQALTFQPEHSRARTALERALEEKRVREMKAETTFEQGVRALREGESETAVRDFRATLELNPHHPEAGRRLTEAKEAAAASLVARGDQWLRERDWDQALEAFEQARAYHVRFSGLDERLDRVRRERRAEVLVDEGDRAFEQENWKVAHERYSSARALTDYEEFQARWDTARERLAADLFARAETAEAAGDLKEAAMLYRSIGEVDLHYRDAAERAERLTVALERAEESYAAGCRAQMRRDLLAAQDDFQTCGQAIPGFRDVEQRLAAVRDELESAARFYERGLQAEERGDYERAQVLFDECLQIASPFRDLPDRLTSLSELIAQREWLERTYAEASRAQELRDLERAYQLFSECRRTDATFRDAARRLSAIGVELGTAASLYKRASRADKRCDLVRAETLYDECLTISNPFRDAAARLTRIRDARRWLDEAVVGRRQNRLVEARAHCHRVIENYEAHVEARELLAEIDHEFEAVDRRYDEMLRAEESGDFRRAFEHGEAIRKRVPGYKDVGERLGRLGAEIDYADGCRLEAEGSYQEASRHFESCLDRKPDFRDARKRLAHCRSRKSDR